MTIIRISELTGTEDPFSLYSTLSRKSLLLWESYFEMQDIGEIVDRKEYYYANILHFLHDYTQETRTKVDDHLMKFNKAKMKSKLDIEDEFIEQERRMAAKIKRMQRLTEKGKIQQKSINN